MIRNQDYNAKQASKQEESVNRIESPTSIAEYRGKQMLKWMYCKC